MGAKKQIKLPAEPVIKKDGGGDAPTKKGAGDAPAKKGAGDAAAKKGAGDAPTKKGAKKEATKKVEETLHKTKPKKEVVNCESYKKINLLLEPAVQNWWEDPPVLVAFALPRITARIEKLMGSNVIRLTDRKFMNEVRSRMQKDYEVQLKKRITEREVKETERERNLILEGKTDVVPEDQSDHPIFVVNKAANEIINARRAKLKTNREKNAERLASQFAKWEKERIRYDQLEIERQQKRIKEQKEEKALIANYAKEDKKRELDLLRIHDQNWRPGEEDLRDFLEKERAKMKDRSWKIPTPFLSDPLDIQNIVRARKQFREAEKQVRTDLVTKTGTDGSTSAAKRALVEAGAKLKEVKLKKKDNFEIVLSDSNISLMDKIEFDTDKNRQAKIVELEGTIAADVEKGLIMPVAKYQSLYFEDPQIAKLRTTDTIKKLYILAKEIITGEKTPEKEGEEEEEDEEEEEEVEEENDEDDNEQPETEVEGNRKDEDD